MNITIKEVSISSFYTTVKMIKELMRFNKNSHNSSRESLESDEQSEKLLQEWLLDGEVYNIVLEGKPVGFFYVKFSGQNVACLKDLFILEEYRCSSLNKYALDKLDKIMIEKNILVY